MITNKRRRMLCVPAVTGATPETQKLIFRYGLVSNRHGATMTIATRRFYTGHTLRDYQHVLPGDTPGFVFVEGWSIPGIRMVWICRIERAIFTYCEGDLDITVDAIDGHFLARLQAAEKFYSGV